MATAVDLSCDFILRAHADLQGMLREVYPSGPQKPRTAGRANDRFEHAFDYVLQGRDVMSKNSPPMTIQEHRCFVLIVFMTKACA